VETIEREARGFLDAIRASISRTFCRFLGWAMFKILRRLTSRLLVAPEQLERVKRADESGIPIVYLPLHKVGSFLSIQSHSLDLFRATSTTSSCTGSCGTSGFACRTSLLGTT
jgi:hypothetical protein